MEDMMMNLTLDDIDALQEAVDVECKLAAGEDGKGAIPKSFWETYSAFANTEGGHIFLGLKQNKDYSFSLHGIEDVAKVKKELFDLANDRNKISASLLSDKTIHEHIIDGKSVLEVRIPRARRKDKPVYVGKNPLTGTYIRRHEGDYKLDEESVKRMLAEQSDESPDSVILKHYGFDDLDMESLKAYRNTFSSRAPEHPFLAEDTKGFLHKIGGWRRDRETGEEGLTVAGLLMFGQWRSIRDYLPYYSLDYQERPEARAERRWIDRLTTDGSWSGNLYDFYRKVYPKLVADLKVPFELEGPTRIDETPVHKALREALVNTLIHADYKGRLSILVVKRPDMFGFRNPGLMRVPVEYAVQGGNSDCRNRHLQDMFRYIGAGEQAGSGIPQILQSWKGKHWRRPRIVEQREPADQTIFELHMVSLFPKEAVEHLESLFGSRFNQLEEAERNILVICYTEETIDHKRIKELSVYHPSDISKALHRLAKEGFLKTGGSGRGMTYHLPSSSRPDTGSTDLEQNPIDSAQNPIDSAQNPIDSERNPIDLPWQEEAILSDIIKGRKNVPRQDMEKSIISLCKIRNQTPEMLAMRLNKNSTYLRHNYLKSLVQTGKLSYLYPDNLSHPKQAYVYRDGNEIDDQEDQNQP